MDIITTAHTKGAIHCGVRPENIVCSLGDEIKSPFIIDWGLAIVIGEDTATGF